MAVRAHVVCIVKNEAAVNLYIHVFVCAPASISLGLMLVYK